MPFTVDYDLKCIRFVDLWIVTEISQLYADIKKIESVTKLWQYTFSWLLTSNGAETWETGSYTHIYLLNQFHF